MLLNSHPGARYGIPFPVLARASFGVLGANFAAVLRALVACGWFGIQTWIGGEAINTLISLLARAGQKVTAQHRDLLHGLLADQSRCHSQRHRIHSISARNQRAYSAGRRSPAARLGLQSGGGFGPMLSAHSRFTNFSDFLKFLIPALNGTVGFWATVSLNIPDFTRFAKSQRQQVIGQALGLPTTMTLYSLIGILVTSATVVIYGTAIWDPVQLLSRFHSPVAVVISLLAILLATLNVNIGANVVSPANDFSNLWPRKINFRTGGIITCFMGIALMPWKLLSDYGTFIFGWLGGYAAFLGPVAGIMICDYFVIRRRVLVVDDLYLRGGVYEYSRGFNWRAVLALALGAGTALVGLVISPLRILYAYSWFVGFAVSFVAYLALMNFQRKTGRRRTDQ